MYKIYAVTGSVADVTHQIDLWLDEKLAEGLELVSTNGELFVFKHTDRDVRREALEEVEQTIANEILLATESGAEPATLFILSRIGILVNQLKNADKREA